MHQSSLQPGAHATVPPSHNPPILHPQPHAPVTEAAAASHLPASTAGIGKKERKHGIGSAVELRLVDYTSDDEEGGPHSPSHTGHASLGSHRSRSLQAGQSTGSMPTASLSRPNLGLKSAHASEADSLVQHATAREAVAAAASDGASEPGPPGVGSPAVSLSVHSRPSLEQAIASKQRSASVVQRPVLVLEDGADSEARSSLLMANPGPLQQAQASHVQAHIESQSFVQASLRISSQQLQQQLPAAQPSHPAHRRPRISTSIDPSSEQQHAFAAHSSPTSPDISHSHRLAVLTSLGTAAKSSADLVEASDGQLGTLKREKVTSANPLVTTQDTPSLETSKLRLADPKQVVKAAALQSRVLEALREIGGQHMTLALMTQTKALKAVQALCSSQVGALRKSCLANEGLAYTNGSKDHLTSIILCRHAASLMHSIR